MARGSVDNSGVPLVHSRGHLIIVEYYKYRLGSEGNS